MASDSMWQSLSGTKQRETHTQEEVSVLLLQDDRCFGVKPNATNLDQSYDKVQ